MASARFGESQRDGAHTTNGASLDADEEEQEEEQYELLARYPENADYYSILGFSRQRPPTDSQLRSAYHNLTLSFHPDKQPAHLVEAAQAQFRRIQDAYETLIDPKKRIVYDLEGEEGVKREWGASGSMGSRKAENHTQVGPRTMSPTEFRRWFLAKMKAREREALDSLVSARVCTTSSLSCVVDRILEFWSILSFTATFFLFQMMILAIPFSCLGSFFQPGVCIAATNAFNLSANTFQGTMSIGINASSLVSAGEEEGYVQLNVPTARLSRFGLGYAFSTSLPEFSGLWTWISGNRRDVEGEPLQEDAKTPSPEINFQTSITGAIRKTKQQIQVEHDDGTTEIIKVIIHLTNFSKIKYHC
jgi:DnaJ domain